MWCVVWATYISRTWCKSLCCGITVICWTWARIRRDRRPTKACNQIWIWDQRCSNWVAFWMLQRLFSSTSFLFSIFINPVCSYNNIDCSPIKGMPHLWNIGIAQSKNLFAGNANKQMAIFGRYIHRISANVYRPFGTAVLGIMLCSNVSSSLLGWAIVPVVSTTFTWT